MYNMENLPPPPSDMPEHIQQKILEKLANTSDETLAKLANGDPINISLDSEPGQVDVEHLISPMKPDVHVQKDSDEEESNSPIILDSDEQSEDLKPSSKSCEDGRAKWNGTIKTPLPDDEFSTRMDQITTYLLDGTLPQFENNPKKRKFIFATRQKYFLDNGKLFFKRRAGKPALQVETNKNEQFKIIQCVHKGLGKKVTGGHLGRNTCTSHVASRYFWPRITEDVKKFISSCTECQRNKVSHLQAPKETLKPVSVPQGVWTQIGIDLMTMPCESPEGHKYIMTCIDYFSKWVEFFALKDKTGESVAKCLYTLMCRYGPAKIHITDRGREFVNSISTGLYHLTGVHHRVTGAYHPQANGLCERQNGATLASIRKSVQENIHDWHECLDGIAYAYRASSRRATGRSPFEIFFGRKMSLPLDLLNNVENCADLTGDEVVQMEEEMLGNMDEPTQEEIFEAAQKVRKEMFDQVSANIRKEQSDQKSYYDKRHQGSAPLEVGTKVMRRNMEHSGRKGGKMDYQFYGPYTIVDVDKDKSKYTLQTETGKILAQKINGCNLKLYHKVSEAFPHVDLLDNNPVYTSRQKRARKSRKNDGLPSSQSSQGSGVTNSQPDFTDLTDEDEYDLPPAPTASSTPVKVPPTKKAKVVSFRDETTEIPVKMNKLSRRKGARPMKILSPVKSMPTGPAGRMEFPSEGEDNDITVVIGRYSPPLPDVKFNPYTTLAERRVLCERMGLSAQKCRYSWKLNNHKITETVLMKKMQEDGNCMFRCISYLLCGSEEGHSLVRERICNVIRAASPNSIVGRYLNETSDIYLARTHMTEEKIAWGTDVEIFVAAQILKCDIWTYALKHAQEPAEDTLAWFRFPYNDAQTLAEEVVARREGGVKFSYRPTQQALYMDNSRGNHYDAVIGFS